MHLSVRQSSFLKKIVWLLIVFILVAVIVPYLFDINNYRDYVAERIGEEIGHQITIGHLKLFLGMGVGIQGENLNVYIRDDTDPIFSAKKIILYFSLFELLYKRFEVKSFSLINPKIKVIRDLRGKLNLENLVPYPQKPPEREQEYFQQFSIHKFSIKNGELHYIDLTDKQDNFAITNLESSISHFDPDKGFQLFARFIASRPESGIIGNFKIKTRVNGRLREKEDLEIGANVSVKSLNPTFLKHYSLRLLPEMWLEKGKLDIEGEFKGYLSGDFRLNAKLEGRDVVFAYPETFINSLPMDTISLKVESVCKGPRIDIRFNEIKLMIKGVSVDGLIEINDILRDDTAIDLRMGFSPFDVQFAHKYFLYPRLPENVRKIIKKSLTKGELSKVKVKLKGRTEDIVNIATPGNEGILMIAASMEDGRVMLPDQGGIINKIEGDILLANGNLSFDKISGFWDGLPISAQNLTIGKIYQEPEYYWKGNLPILFENSFVKKHLEQLAFLSPTGKGIIQIEANVSGKSTTSRGLLDLKESSYIYPPWLKKHKGQHNKIRFDLIQQGNLVKFKKLSYELGDKTKIILDNSQLNLIKQQFQLKFVKVAIAGADLLKYSEIGLFKKLQPSGDIILKGSAISQGNDWELTGSMDFTKAEYHYPLWLVKPLNVPNQCNFTLNITPGKVLKMTNLEYQLDRSHLDLGGSTVRLTDTEFFLKLCGNLSSKTMNKYLQKDFLKKLKPEGGVSFDIELQRTAKEMDISGKLDLSKTGYYFSDHLIKPPRLSNEIDFQIVSPEENQWQIKQLDFFLKDNTISVTGEIENLDEPIYDITLQTDSVELAEIYPVISPSYTKSLNSLKGELALNAHIIRTSENSENHIKLDVTNGVIPFKEYPVTLYNFRMTADTLDGNKYQLVIASGSAGYQNLALDKIKANAAYDPSLLAISNLYLETSEGSLSADGTFNFDKPLPAKTASNKSLSSKPADGEVSPSEHVNKEHPPIEYDIKFAFKNVDVTEFLKGLRKDSFKRISGILNLDGHLNNRNVEGRYTEYPDGNLNLSLIEGRIKQHGWLSKILYLVNPDAFVRNGSDFNTEGFSYNSIKGKFSIKGGILHTEDLLLDSNSWKVLIVGDVDYPKEELDLKVFVQPFRLVDSVVEAIPIIGRIIKEKKRGALDAYFTVKGPYKDPEITSQQIEGIVDKTFGIIKRFFTLPYDLYKENTSP